jgi:hypothetical protein
MLAAVNKVGLEKSSERAIAGQMIIKALKH